MGYIYTKSGKLAKRLYFGAVLLFEGLYYTFKNRVLADGGTFLENELPTISQDAKLVLTPNAYKAGKLYSAVPNDGAGDFTVDRNSTATYMGQDGLIKTALANVPRIDFSSGEAALLIEPQRTNLIPFSSVINWNKFSSGGSSLVGTLMNGLPALEISATANREFYGTQVNILAGLTYRFSFYVDAFSGAFSRPLCYFTDQTLVKVQDENLVIGRNSFTFTPSVSSTQTIIFGVGTDTNDSGQIKAGGFQLEQASIASSYIPTNGSTVTRLADNISVPTPAGVTSITETIDGVDQTPITTIPATYSLPVGNINKVKML